MFKKIFTHCTLVLMASVGLVISSSVLAETAQCASTKVLSGVDYWFWKGYKGLENIRDTESRHFGFFAHDNKACFSVYLSYSEDPKNRLRGSKDALRELVGVSYRDQANWDTPKLAEERHRMQMLTGKKFGVFSEFQKWWIENNDFFVWSDTKGHLIVDQEAKQKGMPIAPHNPVQEISAQRYWYYEGLDWIRESEDKEGKRFAVIWSGAQEINASILLKVITDDTAKTAGYLDALELIIEDRFEVPELGAKGERELMARLAIMTSENFHGKKQWINWWGANKKSLVLSKDKTHLVKK